MKAIKSSMRRREELEKDLKQLDRNAEALAIVKKLDEERLKKEKEKEGIFGNLSTKERAKPEIRLRLLTPKSKAEIVASGTSEEVGYLMAIDTSANIENLKWDGIERGDRYALEKRLSDIEKEEANKVSSIIGALEIADTDIEEAMKNFQWKAQALARYVAQWSSYETITEGMNFLLKYTPFNSKQWLVKNAFPLDGNVEVKVNNSQNGFYLEFDEDAEVGLKYMINLRRELLLKAMYRIKEITEAVDMYLKHFQLSEEFLYPNIVLCLDDMREEEFYSTLQLKPKFFKRTIYERIAKGEKVTEKEIEEAVFPDFYELKPDKEKVERYFKTLCDYQEMQFSNFYDDYLI